MNYRIEPGHLKEEETETFIQGADGLIALSRISRIALAVLVENGIVSIILPNNQIVLSGKLGAATASKVSDDIASAKLAKRVEVIDADQL